MRPITTTRRLAVLAGVVALAAAACGSDDDADDGDADTAATEPPSTDAPPADDSESDDPFAPGVLDSGATVDRYDRGAVTVHTYTNPEAGFGNTTTIIESENALVLIDAHFSEESAAEFRAYADSLDKPIERLIITHEHPDHIGGVEPVFGDVTSMSSPGVIDAAAAAGTTIDEALEAGEETIDGIRYVFDVYDDAEAPEQVVTHLPDHGVISSGDLVYNEYHFFMTPNFDNWLVILDELAARDGIELVLPGHGLPGGPEAFDDARDYLSTARDVYADSADGDTFSAAMIEAYPDRPGTNLLQFGLGQLFPKPDA